MAEEEQREPRVIGGEDRTVLRDVGDQAVEPGLSEVAQVGPTGAAVPAVVGGVGQESSTVEGLCEA